VRGGVARGAGAARTVTGSAISGAWVIGYCPLVSSP
jgi:hypothetical protein